MDDASDHGRTPGLVHTPVPDDVREPDRRRVVHRSRANEERIVELEADVRVVGVEGARACTGNAGHGQGAGASSDALTIERRRGSSSEMVEVTPLPKFAV